MTAASTQNGKGKARTPTKLELFQAMPLDVLVLVSHVTTRNHPAVFDLRRLADASACVQTMEKLDTKTLLAMSRTCSTFRSLLHSDQGTTAWKRARANTSAIPDLQADDLEEWMLASLLFDSTCHVRRSCPRLLDVWRR